MTAQINVHSISFTHKVEVATREPSGDPSQLEAVFTTQWNTRALELRQAGALHATLQAEEEIVGQVLMMAKTGQVSLAPNGMLHQVQNWVSYTHHGRGAMHQLRDWERAKASLQQVVAITHEGDYINTDGGVTTTPDKNLATVWSNAHAFMEYHQATTRIESIKTLDATTLQKYNGVKQ